MDWSPLANNDPLPGNPEGIHYLVNVLRAQAEECKSVEDKLSNFAVLDWTGHAADAFQKRKEEFKPKLSAIYNRLDSTSWVLGNFAQQADAIQQQARSILAQARSVQASIWQVQPNAQAQTNYEAQQRALVAAGKPYVPWTGPNYRAQLAQYKSQYRTLVSRFNQEVNTYNDLASRTTNQLHNVAHDNLKNNVFSVLGHYAKDALNVVVAVEAAELHLANDVVNAIEKAAKWAWEHRTMLLHLAELVVGVVALFATGGLAAGLFIAAVALGAVGAANDVADHYLVANKSSGFDFFVSLLGDVAGIGGGFLINGAKAWMMGGKAAISGSNFVKNVILTEQTVKTSGQGAALLSRVATITSLPVEEKIFNAVGWVANAQDITGDLAGFTRFRGLDVTFDKVLLGSIALAGGGPIVGGIAGAKIVSM